MLCFVVPCVFGLSACKKADPNLTNYKVIVNQQLIAESREIDVTYGDEIEWSAIALYDDNSITAIPATEMQVVDEGEIIGTTPTVGEYELKFKYDEFNEYVVTLTVNPKALAVPTAEAMTYSGEEQTAVFDGFDANTMTMTGDVTATDANTYSVSVALKDKTNYCWTGGSTTDKVVEYTIDKAKIQEPNRVDKTYTYNGTSQTLELFGFDSQTMEVSNNSGINADEYTAYVDIIDDDNYEWKHNSGSRIAIYWTIEKAEGTAPETAPTALSGTYSPSKTLADYDVAEYYAWADETVVPTVAVSEYDVIYNPDPTNYTDYAMTYVLNIAKAQLVIPEVTGAALEYDGTEKTVELAHFDADLMRKSGEISAVEVGEHTMLVIVDNGNYEFDDGSISAEIKWNIGKGTPAVTIPYNYSKQYDGQRINLPRYEMPALLKAELEGDADGIVVSYEDANGEAIDLANIVATGEYKIVVETAETTHYKAHSVSQSFTIFYHLTTLYNNDVIRIELTNDQDDDRFVYTGSAVVPNVAVYNHAINIGTPEEPIPYTLEQNKDYVVNAFNNTLPTGDAYVEITGIGIYAGKIVEKFYIYLEDVLQGVAVNGNAVENLNSGDAKATTISNPAGHTLTWTFNPTYSSIHANGYCEITVQDKFGNFISSPIVLDKGVVTTVVPSNTVYVDMTYHYDGNSMGVADFKICLSDVVNNANYVLSLNGSECGVASDRPNFIIIASNADDRTSTAEKLVRAAFASPSNYTLAEGYTLVEDGLTFAADGKTVTVKITNGTELELVYDIFDARAEFFESYVNFEYIRLNNNYVTPDAQNTITIQKANLDTYVYFSLNDGGNIPKVELIFGGDILQTDVDNIATEDIYNIQGVSSLRYEYLFTEAGEYIVRFYLNNADTEYVDYKIVIENYDTSSRLKLTYNGKEYEMLETFDGGIYAGLANGNMQHFYSYVGTLGAGVETITVAIESTLDILKDNNHQLIADNNNVVLEVLTDADSRLYTVMYLASGNVEIPYYIYFEEEPEFDFVFSFADVSLNFKFDYDEPTQSSNVWSYGEFVSHVDPTTITPTTLEGFMMPITLIELEASVDIDDVDFKAIDETLKDTTVVMEIESTNILACATYDLVNGYAYSGMVGGLTSVHLAVGEDNGPVLSLFVYEVSIYEGSFPTVMYQLNIKLV